MKTKYAIAVCLLITAAACSSFKEESVSPERGKAKTEEMFYATLEQSGAADATKVYADENLKVLWNADDRISIFNRYTYGYEYAFQGSTGDTAGAFVKEEDDAEFVTGNPLDMIYAVYPYSADNKISNSGEMTVLWPYTQTYKPDSFGIGANVMVSVTSNNQLRFKNVGGYLALKLYGDNVSVSSIVLWGNNGERLSGKATITDSLDGNPTLSFGADAQGALRLECDQPVEIGNTPESATTFWLVLPPTHFSGGFCITVCTDNGGVFVKSTESSYDIQRNTLCRMAAVEVLPSEIVPFECANFKAYCTANFDMDSDGEISFDEALAITTIEVNTDNIESLRGVEYFENLTSLSCCGTFNSDSQLPNGKLTSLNLSRNTALTTLNCYTNQLTSLDVANNASLVELDCSFNQLTTLDVSHNLALFRLVCSGNLLSDLDLSHNNSLTILYCYSNQLNSLDITYNTALEQLYCMDNLLTSIDVSHNTALTTLGCDYNQLTELDISENPTLHSLDCSDNQLAAIDLSNNTALTTLNCDTNQLTALDLSNNTTLISLHCENNQLTSIDLSNNTALTTLDCSDNQLASIDLSNNTALTSLYCGTNQLTSLDVSNIISLTRLYSNNNKLTSLDVSNNTTLISLHCKNNQLASLDVSYNTALALLVCDNNQLTSLDVSNNKTLAQLFCQSNQLSFLDVSNNSALIRLCCYSNPYLTEIWLKTGQTIAYLVYDTDVAQVYYKD